MIGNREELLATLAKHAFVMHDTHAGRPLNVVLIFSDSRVRGEVLEYLAGVGATPMRVLDPVATPADLLQNTPDAVWTPPGIPQQSYFSVQFTQDGMQALLAELGDGGIAQLNTAGRYSKSDTSPEHNDPLEHMRRRRMYQQVTQSVIGHN